MTVAAAPLGTAGRERLAALASEIDAARRRHAPATRDARRIALADRPVDAVRIADAARAVAAVLAAHGALTAGEAAALRDAQDLAAELPSVIAWAAGPAGPPPFAEAPIVWSVVRLILPAFIGADPASDPERDPSTADGCPVCGMRPDLAILDATGARQLVCGACDTAWYADRIRCPFCGSGAQDRMAYLVGGAPGYVLRVCDACGTYLKTIDRRVVRDDATPLLLRLLSAEMDLAAERSGYRPPA